MKGRLWEEAIEILNSDIAENPTDPWSPMFMGSCHYELRRYSDAMDWFEHAAALDPKNPTPIGLQGNVLHCLGEVEKARERYLKALALEPHDPLAIKNWERFQEIEAESS